MKGHIRERSPGYWAIVIELRDPETGKRRRKWHSFHGTKRKAQDKCAQLISELSGGLYIEPDKITVRQFLDRWLEHIKSQVSPRTHERYDEIVKKNLNPLLGAVVNEIAADADFRCVRQSSFRWPQGRQGRTFSQHGALPACHPQVCHGASCALADACSQSGRCGRSSQDRA
jgi:hypothetical protein